MIAVCLALGERGNLVSAEASGHAGFGTRGTDIVCAAVTVLLRTTVTVLSGHGLDVKAETAGRGSLSFRVTAFSGADVPLLVYAGNFLEEGLGSLSREFPGSVEMRILKAQGDIDVVLED